MNGSNLNPYAVPDTFAQIPLSRTRFRDQHIPLQLLLYPLFFFAGLAIAICMTARATAVPGMFFDVLTDFSSVWLPEVTLVTIPYILIRSLTIGRRLQPFWLLHCIGGTATFLFLWLYMDLLVGLVGAQSTSTHHIVVHLLSVASAILAELLVVALWYILPKFGRGTTERTSS